MTSLLPPSISVHPATLPGYDPTYGFRSNQELEASLADFAANEFLNPAPINPYALSPLVQQRRGSRTQAARRATSHAAKKPEGHIPRPPNCFLLYRSWARKQKIQKMSEGNKNEQKVSVIVAGLWEELPEDKKAIFRRQAEIIKAEHAAKYPHYKYSPKSKKGEIKRKAKKMDEEENRSCKIIAKKLRHGQEEEELLTGKRRIEDELDGAARLYRRSSSCPIPGAPVANGTGASSSSSSSASTPASQYLGIPNSSRLPHQQHTRAVSAGSSSAPALKIPTVPAVRHPGHSRSSSQTHFTPITPHGPVFTNPFAPQSQQQPSSATQPSTSTPTDTTVQSPFSAAPLSPFSPSSHPHHIQTTLPYTDYDPAPLSSTTPSSSSLLNWNTTTPTAAGPNHSAHSPAAHSDADTATSTTSLNTPQSATTELQYSSNNNAACSSSTTTASQHQLDSLMSFEWPGHSGPASAPPTTTRNPDLLSHTLGLGMENLYPSFPPTSASTLPSGTSSTSSASTAAAQPSSSSASSTANLGWTYARRSSALSGNTSSNFSYLTRRESITGDLFMGPAGGDYATYTTSFSGSGSAGGFGGMGDMRIISGASDYDKFFTSNAAFGFGAGPSGSSSSYGPGATSSSSGGPDSMLVDNGMFESGPGGYMQSLSRRGSTMAGDLFAGSVGLYHSQQHPQHVHHHHQQQEYGRGGIDSFGPVV